MSTSLLTGGFSDPTIQAARAFRAIMEAMARPGTIHQLAGVVPPAPISVAAGTVLLTLCDPDTPLHLAGGMESPEIRAWIAFHTGAPFVSREACLFALGRWEDLGPLSDYPVGTATYPDRSATLIVERDPEDGAVVTLRGPGIADAARLRLPDPDAFRRNHALFPLGHDFLFTSGESLTALPRSTEVL